MISILYYYRLILSYSKHSLCVRLLWKTRRLQEALSILTSRSPHTCCNDYSITSTPYCIFIQNVQYLKSVLTIFYASYDNDYDRLNRNSQEASITVAPILINTSF